MNSPNLFAQLHDLSKALTLPFRSDSYGKNLEPLSSATIVLQNYRRDIRRWYLISPVIALRVEVLRALSYNWGCRRENLWVGLHPALYGDCRSQLLRLEYSSLACCAMPELLVISYRNLCRHIAMSGPELLESPFTVRLYTCHRH